jgi:hypothetical protein
MHNDPLFNAIAILILTLAVGNGIFFTWLYFKIRADEKKSAQKRSDSSQSGCGCSSHKKDQ